MTQNMQLYSMVPLLQAAELRSLAGHPAAIGAYNVNFYAQAEGIIRGLQAAGAPGIIQASKGANEFQGGPDKIQYIILKAIQNLGCNVPIALHLDHGNEQAAISCIDNGFSSVMIDASSKPELENIAETGKIVKYAHKKGVSVEAEYGLLAGVEEDIVHQKSVYADPKFVPVFFDRSGADALAIAYGTSHGPNKGKTDSLNLAVVAESYAGLKAYNMNLNKFLVSHGSSTVPAQFVAMINQYGGNLTGSSGVPEYMITRAISLGMRKVNIDTDLRLRMVAELRKWYSENPDAPKNSELVSLITGMLDGKIQAIDIKKKTPIQPEMITDPRNWLQAIRDQSPEILREDYRDTKDPVFIEVMGLMSNTVAEHVKTLSGGIFGGSDLAASVDTSLTLEEMAKTHNA